MKEENGITLVSLVITIIVLLILAGVVLVTLTGNSNIIENANKAVGQYNDKVQEEQELLSTIEQYLQNYVGIKYDIPKVDANGLATENTTITTDGENVQIVIPKGMAPVILTGSSTTTSEPRTRWKCSKYNAS